MLYINYYTIAYVERAWLHRNLSTGRVWILDSVICDSNNESPEMTESTRARVALGRTALRSALTLMGIIQIHWLVFLTLFPFPPSA